MSDYSYDPYTAAFLNTNYGNTGGGVNSWLSDPVANQSNQQINAGWNKHQRQKDIEWVNQQRMTDPAYWAKAFGMNSSGGGNSLGSLVNPQNFDQSPAYKWAFEQGREAVNRTAAAKRMLGSGNRLAELTKFGQGLASQEYGNEFNRQLQAKQLDAEIRRMNMQSAMGAMEMNKRYMPPGQFNTPAGIVNRWD